MKRDIVRLRRLTLAGAAFAFSLFPLAGSAADRDRQISVRAADPTEQGDGTMSAPARAAMLHGPLPKSAEEVAAKLAATRASDRALSSGTAAAPAGPSGPLATISGGHNFAGQFNPGSAPPDTTGAIGTTRYIQLVNTKFRIYNRTTEAPISWGTLNQLAGLASTVNTFDPQIIWDAQTNRFYYVNDSIFSASDNRLSFGFSKTASPNNGTTDFCHYTFPYGAEFPDYPKLGDSQHFIIIGVNTFAPSFVGSDIVAISKPPAGATCPGFDSFKTGVKVSLTDAAAGKTFTPVPSNQIDTNATGHVVARNGIVPSTSLWFYSVTRNAGTGLPEFSVGRSLTVPNYILPPDAPAGAGATRKLDTLDARPTQAVQAINPDRNPDTFSFWVQHTIGNGAAGGGVSGIRWYEINPVPAAPVKLIHGNIFRGGTFLFNAAISPDRKVATGVVSQFGDSFAIHFSVTKSTAPGINPRIEVASSFSGAPLGAAAVIKSSPGPYVDFTCGGTTSTCRWGDYAGANPDPAPPADTRGVVWGTNQWGSGGTSTGVANWRTQIFALRP